MTEDSLKALIESEDIICIDTMEKIVPGSAVIDFYSRNVSLHGDGKPVQHADSVTVTAWETSKTKIKESENKIETVLEDNGVSAYIDRGFDDTMKLYYSRFNFTV